MDDGPTSGPAHGRREVLRSCPVNRPVPAPGAAPLDALARGADLRRVPPAPASLRESAVVDRRRASLTALSTLARRPRPELTLAAPPAPAPVDRQRPSLIV